MVVDKREDGGYVTPIEAAYAQGDNNDRFVIEGSLDGQSFSELWIAPRVSGNGLRASRAVLDAKTLDVVARFTERGCG